MQSKFWTSLALAVSIVIGITAANEVVAETVYARASKPTANSYVAEPLYAHNPRGRVQIRRQGTGRYRVEFMGFSSSEPDKPGNRGHVQVSAYGTADRCSIGSWNFKRGFTVNVICFKGGTANTPVDARFTVMATLADLPSMGAMRMRVASPEIKALQKSINNLSRRLRSHVLEGQ